jgi:hypothetical protein
VKYIKFDYGDEVVFRTQDESGASVAKQCSVVGITPVETAAQSIALSHPVGAVLYTVEFGDGSDKLVPEDQLEPMTEQNGSA